MPSTRSTLPDWFTYYVTLGTGHANLPPLGLPCAPAELTSVRIAKNWAERPKSAPMQSAPSNETRADESGSPYCERPKLNQIVVQNISILRGQLFRVRLGQQFGQALELVTSAG